MHFQSDDGDDGLKPVCQECGTAFIDQDHLAAHSERCSTRKKKLLNQRSVYISGFNGRIEVALIKQALTQFGNVEKVIVDKEWDRYAIIQFENPEHAVAAILQGNMQIGDDMVTIKKAKLKTDEFGFQPPVIHEHDVSQILQSVNDAPLLEQMNLIMESFGVSEEAQLLRRKICRFLEKQFSTYFDAVIHCRLFGSSISGLGTKYADVDINFVVEPIPNKVPKLWRREIGNVPLAILVKEKLTYEEYESLSMEFRQDLVYRILYDIHSRLSTISHVRSIGKTKCPVVRFTYNGELSCELSIGNIFSEKKAQFLQDITNDEQHILHKILFSLRLWAQTQDIFGSNSSNKPAAFKSYAFSLVFVAYLQEAGIIGPIHFRGNEFTHDWATDYMHPMLQVQANNEWINSVIRGFFVYICQKLKESSVVSIRNAKIYDWEEFWVNAATVDSRITEKFDKSFLNIQDPLELSHNVCASVGRPVIGLLRRKSMYALSKLKSAPCCLSSIFELSENHSNGSETNHSSENGEIQLNLAPNLSPSHVLEAINTVFEDILKFESVPEKSGKRLKTESKAIQGFASYFSTCETWIGRRTIKRELQRKHNDLAIKDVEKMVSSTIQRNALAWDGSNDPLLEFSVETVYDPDTGVITFNLCRKKGEAKKVTDLFHFLQQFFGKDDGQILRSILSLPQTASAGPVSPDSPTAMEIN